MQNCSKELVSKNSKNISIESIKSQDQNWRTESGDVENANETRVGRSFKRNSGIDVRNDDVEEPRVECFSQRVACGDTFATMQRDPKRSMKAKK